MAVTETVGGAWPATGDDGDGGDIRSTRAQRGDAASKQLLKCVEAAAGELFQTPEGKSFIRLRSGGHWEVHNLDSPSFRQQWLGLAYWKAHGRAVTPYALDDALTILKGKAQFETTTSETVHVRLAGDDRAVYLDLGNEAWEVVRVTPEGWDIMSESPVRFQRPDSGYLAIPAPQPGGSINELKKFINVPGDDQFQLLVGFLIAALRPTGPYPILELTGEKGSAKTTTTKFLRQLIDPNVADARAPFTSEETLAIAAENGHLLAFDNFSGGLSAAMSNAMCRMATGSGLARRMLYENNREQIFSYSRPMIVNGIDNVGSRSDLLERMYSIRLRSIPTSQRAHQGKLMAAFERARPELLGALLTAVSSALRLQHRVTANKWPRMRDAAQWITAASPALGWAPGAFLHSLHRTALSVEGRALGEHEAFVETLRALIQSGSSPSSPSSSGRWEGRAHELLVAMREHAPVGADLPGAANALRARLQQLVKPLLSAGILVTFYEQHGGLRLIALALCPPADGSDDDDGGIVVAIDGADETLATGGAPTVAETVLPGVAIPPSELAQACAMGQ